MRGFANRACADGIGILPQRLPFSDCHDRHRNLQTISVLAMVTAAPSHKRTRHPFFRVQKKNLSSTRWVPCEKSTPTACLLPPMRRRFRYQRWIWVVPIRGRTPKSESPGIEEGEIVGGRLGPGRPRANGRSSPERASFPPAAATPSHSTNYRREATGVVRVAASSTRTRTRFYHAPPQPHPG